jgi:hypothetical protein
MQYRRQLAQESRKEMEEFLRRANCVGKPIGNYCGMDAHPRSSRALLASGTPIWCASVPWVGQDYHTFCSAV